MKVPLFKGTTVYNLQTESLRIASLEGCGYILEFPDKTVCFASKSYGENWLSNRMPKNHYHIRLLLAFHRINEENWKCHGTMADSWFGCKHGADYSGLPEYTDNDEAIKKNVRLIANLNSDIRSLLPLKGAWTLALVTFNMPGERQMHPINLTTGESTYENLVKAKKIQEVIFSAKSEKEYYQNLLEIKKKSFHIRWYSSRDNCYDSKKRPLYIPDHAWNEVEKILNEGLFDDQNPE